MTTILMGFYSMVFGIYFKLYDVNYDVFFGLFVLLFKDDKLCDIYILEMLRK